MMSFLYITRFIWPFIFVIALTCAIAGLSFALMYSLLLYLI